MGITLIATGGLIAWIVLWALGISPVAAFLIPLVLVLLATAGKVLFDHVAASRTRGG